MSANIHVQDKSALLASKEAFKEDQNIAAKGLIWIAAQQDKNVAEKAMKHAWFREVAAKVGNSEAGSGTGAELVVESISQIMGQVSLSSQFAKDCRVFNLPLESGSMKVPVITSDFVNIGTAPTLAINAEVPTLTPSNETFAAIDVTPRMQTGLVTASIELIEDVPALQGLITDYMVLKQTIAEDTLAMTGTDAGGAQGFLGVLAGGAGYVATQSVASPGNPTLAEAQGFVSKLAPFWLEGACWYMGTKVWANVKANSAFVSAANINLQLIDINPKGDGVVGMFLGYPVKLLVGMPQNKFVFANPRQFALVRKAGSTLLFSNQAYYTSNQYAWRFSVRVGGTVAAAAYALPDTNVVAAFVRPA